MSKVTISPPRGKKALTPITRDRYGEIVDDGASRLFEPAALSPDRPPTPRDVEDEAAVTGRLFGRELAALIRQHFPATGRAILLGLLDGLRQ